MSDTEYEKFEITDFDLENEFNPDRTNRRRPTKNQQIYGIWADDSDANDNDALPSFSLDGGLNSMPTSKKRMGKKGRNKTNYVSDNMPISFVAGGIQQSGKKKTPEEKAAEAKDGNESGESGGDDDDDDDGSKMHFKNDNTSSESDKDGKHTMNEMAGFRTSYSKHSSTFNQRGLANWEQHTKGIGAKLLLQMGYEPGKGLGKDLQGISQPVEAHLRKGRGAIGAYGPEQGQTIGGVKANKKMDEDEQEAKEFKEKMVQWRKDSQQHQSQMGINKTKRYYYKSVEDIIEKGKNSHNTFSNQLSTKLGNVTVIDMTGPEKRVLSGYHALGQTKIIEDSLCEKKPINKSSAFSLNELTHNLNLILDMCEQEIIMIDKKQRSSNERESMLKRKKENLEAVVELESNHIQTLENVLALVQNLVESTEPPLDLNEAAKIFIKLQNEYPTEYKEFGVGDLAPGIIAPLFNIRLDDWRPLDEPTKYIDLLRQWQTILIAPSSSPSNSNNTIAINSNHSQTLFEPYSALVWSGVMPSIRSAVASWTPRVHQPMAALLEAWAPLLPTYILDNILEQLVLPRITTCVDDWDPLTDTIPIHMWVLPWSQLLEEKLNAYVYPMIRDKLGNALTAWLPNDRSALAMLTPWKLHFTDGDMQCFLIKHILPKLQLSLNELIINPLQQDLECWNQVWEWKDVIPTLLMAQLLEKFFFTKWIQTLVIWLNQSSNLDQVSRWYSGWKSLFGDSDVLKQTNVKEYFRRALELMHRSTGATSNIPVDPDFENTDSSNKNNIQPPALMDLQLAPPIQLEFKELVSQKCAERGIIFAPMPGRRELGKQVYRIGKLFCYIDRSIVMVSDGTFSNWQPTSLTTLMNRELSGIF